MQRSGARVGCTYTLRLSRPFTVEGKLWIFGYKHIKTAYEEAFVGGQDSPLANVSHQMPRISLWVDHLCQCHSKRVVTLWSDSSTVLFLCYVLTSSEAYVITWNIHTFSAIFCPYWCYIYIYIYIYIYTYMSYFNWSYHHNMGKWFTRIYQN